MPFYQSIMILDERYLLTIVKNNNSSEFNKSEFGVCFSQENYNELLMSDLLVDIDNLGLANDNTEEILDSQNVSSAKGQKQGRKRLHKSKSNHSDIFTMEVRQQVNSSESLNFRPLQHNHPLREKGYLNLPRFEPLALAVQDTCKRLYIPASNMSLDEMIVHFSGRSAHTVRMKFKPTPEGYKILALW
ncbi:10246_t:CDS:2 [Dentiscutata erythropus]|uniref:10246_t:CDS:1 n=1 Tax=Dentiscutata erythropus TaxID=1348616 RepID=A0A9N9HLM8_9GLOM|nr:10246_t:CDS:2 [Dentiscutata erythropus]